MIAFVGPRSSWRASSLLCAFMVSFAIEGPAIVAAPKKTRMHMQPSSNTWDFDTWCTWPPYLAELRPLWFKHRTDHS